MHAKQICRLLCVKRGRNRSRLKHVLWSEISLPHDSMQYGQKISYTTMTTAGAHKYSELQ